jgi:hypothetical protein
VVARTRHWRSNSTQAEVYRDSAGRIRRAPAAARAAAELKAWARRMVNMEDRTGPVLRWGQGVNGWWYMVKGPRRWIRRESRPGWHHGYYYVPKSWGPVVPPRDSWDSPRSYHGIPGQTPLGPPVVPQQVWDAAHTFPEDLAGLAAPYETSPRSTAFTGRRNRAGLGYEEKRGRETVRKVTTGKKSR